MSVRLIKISKDLNVGINSLVKFLQEKGIEVDENPNTKIDREKHEMLIKEFGTSADLEKYKEKLKTQAPKAAPKQEVKKEEPIVEKVADVIETKIPDSIKPNIQVVDKIDLDALNKPASKKEDKSKAKIESSTKVETPTEPVKKIDKKEVQTTKTTTTPQVEKQVKKPEVKVVKAKEEPKKEEPQKVVQQPKEAEVDNTEVKDDEIFRFREANIESNIVVKGTIDLSAINDRTRPAKKSKVEKKKERQEKELDSKKQKDAAIKQLKKEVIKKDDADEANKKRKRSRIKNGRVDIKEGAQQADANRGKHPNNNRANAPKKTLNKAVVTEEDVQKQIKETLARLTDNKRGKNKGARYRKEKRNAQSQRQQEEIESQERESKILKITEFVTANDLANMMDIPVVQVIQTCMSIGMMVSINQRLDAETINIVADEFGFQTEYVSAEVVEAIAEEEDKEEDLQPRAPIVTVMGHVDHGKTSLLDYVRKANVIAGEAGGITQHIGAYNVQIKSGRRITFLDTPGHEAFTAMRARGAQVTDIAIIIVAADDSVMPQTIEAINHASAAGVPIVFAINKIDKPTANPEKIKEALANMNYLVEDWGGKYQSQEISAKKGLGVEELLEKVLLEADLLDLKANPNRRAVGSVIESSLDKGRGYTSTILVQNGTLNVGDIILAGTSHGRVRAMFNERNQVVTSAAPSEPVQILGLNGAPQAGDSLHVLETEQEAREIATKREQLQREQGLRTQKILTLDDIGRRIAIGNFQQLNLIVKADMDGSVEALSDSLLKLSTPEIQLNVIHKGVGQISESDVTLAAASDAIIVGFQVRPSVQARRLAEAEGVDIRLYSIIYDAIEEIKSAMEGMLSPEIKEIFGGYVEVREVFKITKVGTVAGCFVKEGKLKRTNKIRLVRDGIVIYSGELGSLKRFKDDAKEVVAGLECGLNIHNYNDIKVGDIIEPFEEIEIKKTL